MPFDAAPPAEVTTRDRVIRLRDFIANLDDPRKLDMGCFEREVPECGTVCCIAGWANRLYQPDANKSLFGATASARHLLGLGFTQSHDLFYPTEYGTGRYTRDDAVKVLDHYLATGKVDWSVI